MLTFFNGWTFPTAMVIKSSSVVRKWLFNYKFSKDFDLKTKFRDSLSIKKYSTIQFLMSRLCGKIYH